MTLRELHGVIQVAMGWEGIHLFQFTLRARRFGSLELAAHSPDIPLSELRLRLGTRVRYEYDLNGPWEHEVRLESRHEADAQRSYPMCLDGDGSCPPEDCGGVNGFLARCEASITQEARHDFAVLAGFIDQLALKRSTGTSSTLRRSTTFRRLWSALKSTKVGRATHSPARTSTFG
jgi:hypothetical protein